MSDKRNPLDQQSEETITNVEAAADTPPTIEAEALIAEAVFESAAGGNDDTSVPAAESNGSLVLLNLSERKLRRQVKLAEPEPVAASELLTVAKNRVSPFNTLPIKQKLVALLLVVFVAIGALGAAGEFTVDENGEGGFLSKMAESVGLKEPSAAHKTKAARNTLQISKEYIYAGSRMLAVEDYGVAGSGPNPTPTPATSYNAVMDYSSTANPTGVWSYGYRSLANGTYTSFTGNGYSYGGSTLHVWSPSAGGQCCGMVAKNLSGSTYTYVDVVQQPADLLNVHPNGNGDKSVVRWTAPSSGNYQIAGRFQGIDTVGTTTDVHIIHNNQEIWANAVNGFGNQASYSLTRTIAAGDTIDFVVGYGSNNTYNNDSTGLAATIVPSGSNPTPTPIVTPTPTPATPTPTPPPPTPTPTPAGPPVPNIPANQYFQIVAQHSNKCADVAGVSQNDTALVHQWGCGNDSPGNQLWKFERIGDEFQIIAQHSGKCMDVIGGHGATGDGIGIQQYTCVGASQPNQLWRIIQIGSGNAYQIVSKNSGKCLDVPYSDQNNGIGLKQYTCGSPGQPNQTWAISVPLTPPLGPPPVPAVTSVTQNSDPACLNVTLNGVSGANSYDVQITNSGYTINVTTLSFPWCGLSPATYYEYRARSVGTYGTSDWSGTTGGTTGGAGPPATNNSSPMGHFDGIDGNLVIGGWSYDPDDPNNSNDVHVYIGGPAGGGGVGYAVTANGSRPDVNNAFGIGGNHGFSFQIPAQFNTGQYTPVYVYGIDRGTNSPTLLQGSPQYFGNPPDPPACEPSQQDVNWCQWNGGYWDYTSCQCAYWEKESEKQEEKGLWDSITDTVSSWWN